MAELIPGDDRAAAAVDRLKREPVAWPRMYERRGPAETLEEAWRAGVAEGVVFSAGRFFEIKLSTGRVVQRSPPRDDPWAHAEIRERLRYEEDARPGEVARDQAWWAELRETMGEEGLARYQREKQESDAKLAAGWARFGMRPPPKPVTPDFSLLPVPESLREEIRQKTDAREYPRLLETCRIAVVGQGTSDSPVAWNAFGPVDRRQDPERWAAESRALVDLLAEVEPWRRIEFTDGRSEP